MCNRSSGCCTKTSSSNRLAYGIHDVQPTRRVIMTSASWSVHLLLQVVCYYTNWSQYRPKHGKFLPEDIDPELCTHIIFAFGWLKKGKLSSFESNDETKDGKVGLYERIMTLKKVNPKLKVLLAIGKLSFHKMCLISASVYILFLGVLYELGIALCEDPVRPPLCDLTSATKQFFRFS